MNLPLIVVHGGAGKWKDEKIPVGIEHVTLAAKVGFQALLDGKSALDAAEVCTLYMESCGKLNAGVGATRNVLGQQELDAMVVDGEQQTFGSVASVRGIENPISLARYVMEKTEYAFFAGEGALQQYENMIESGYRKEMKKGIIQKTYENPIDADTVGCIVIDNDGKTAATSSTGGIKKKPLGRVGDSPVFGAGAFGNNMGVATATGYGEHIMRVTLCRDVVAQIENNINVSDILEERMDHFHRITGSEAGVIAADIQGNWAKATNAKAMPVAAIQGELSNLSSFDK